MKKAFLSEILMKKWVTFSGLLMVRTEGADPSPSLTVSLTVNIRFLATSLKKQRTR